MVIYNCNALIEDRLIEKSWVRIREGKIIDIGHGCFQNKSEICVDGGNHFLLPGLIDLHCCEFKKFLSPRHSLSINPKLAINCFEFYCMKNGTTTICNTVRLSDLLVCGEININGKQGSEFNMSFLKPSNMNFIMHLRCDLAWAEIILESVRVCGEFNPKIISFIRCAQGVGRFKKDGSFSEYLKNNTNYESSMVKEYSRSEANENMFQRARVIVEHVRNKGVVFLYS
ncbi:MAG: hypothetical protein H7839_10145 [Magnetococcus sp. YQC-5]